MNRQKNDKPLVIILHNPVHREASEVLGERIVNHDAQFNVVMMSLDYGFQTALKEVCKNTGALTGVIYFYPTAANTRYSEHTPAGSMQAINHTMQSCGNAKQKHIPTVILYTNTASNEKDAERIIAVSCGIPSQHIHVVHATEKEPSLRIVRTLQKSLSRIQSIAQGEQEAYPAPFHRLVMTVCDKKETSKDLGNKLEAQHPSILSIPMDYLKFKETAASYVSLGRLPSFVLLDITAETDENNIVKGLSKMVSIHPGFRAPTLLPAVYLASDNRAQAQHIGKAIEELHPSLNVKMVDKPVTPQDIATRMKLSAQWQTIALFHV